jgi:hypothetical protein
MYPISIQEVVNKWKKIRVIKISVPAIPLSLEAENFAYPTRF